jgi:predicted O-methyltransferase YrrM
MQACVNLREPAALAAIWQDTRELGFNMASEPLGCSLLRTLAATKPAAKILELGSGTGLSTAWLLDGMDGLSQLTTIDHDTAVLKVLRKHLGADPRLQVVCAEGDAYLHSIKGQLFDLIFADAWAGKYRLIEETLALLKPAGIYVVDDMLPQPNWPDGHGVKAQALIAMLEKRTDLTVTKLSWASGLVIAVKRQVVG